MKPFLGKEALIQVADLVKPSIYTPLGTIEFSLAVTSEYFIFLLTVLSSNMADHYTNITTTRLIAS